jgi:hypothetical protein
MFVWEKALVSALVPNSDLQAEGIRKLRCLAFIGKGTTRNRPGSPQTKDLTRKEGF